jgi:hypothetical protein
MPRNLFHGKYLIRFKDLFNASDKGSIFFTVIVNDVIVLNGLNRVMPISAQAQAYDNSDFPRILTVQKDDTVYFRFALDYSMNSIWNSPGKIEVLFKFEMIGFEKDELVFIRPQFEQLFVVHYCPNKVPTLALPFVGVGVA